MTRPDEFTVYQATDRGTPPPVLEQMAGARPDLRQFVAANPSTSPEVLGWLGSLGDPAVAAALARRSAGSATAWATPAQPPPPAGGPAPHPYAAPGGPPARAVNLHAAVNPYAPPAGQAAGPPAGQHGYGPPSPAPFGQPGGYVPTPGDLAATGYGYQPQPTGNRKGLIAAIVIGAVILVGALVFAATSIFSSLETTTLGDDPSLDLLWDECAGGDAAACDDLYWESPLGSDYEEFGDTCGDRQPVGTDRWCRDVM
ncbi:hypothetical protein [Georgenia sp. MJ170]|uniref:variant leucine-rich repeat-containing protein n=1 Tax=Georgenia sunbinii TaxID=3117728 RepID=UPI002F2656F0